MDHPLLENRWQMYVGIFVESTSKKNQRWFHLFVPEFLPIKSGDVSAEDGNFSVTVKNQKTDKNEETNVKITSTIYADYCGFTTGVDVPTIFRGMQALVFNRIGTDKWYWIPLERDDSYKTFEHHRISCADIAQTNKSASEKDDIEGRDAGLTDDNTYFAEIDTKYRKHILLSTSSSDGEEWRYFFKIDAEQHTVELWDNCVDGSQPNNTIKIESRPDPETKGRITLQNASGNSIIMQGEDTIVNIPRNLTVNIGGDTMIFQKGNVAQTIDKDFNRTIKQNMSATTKGSVNRKIMQNNSELVAGSQDVTVMMTHEEKQALRSTTAFVGATTTAPQYSLTVATAGTFNITQWTVISNIISITASQAWSVMTQRWQETAKSVAGSVVFLIRSL